MDVAVEVSPDNANAVNGGAGTMICIAAGAPDMGARAIRRRRIQSGCDEIRCRFGMPTIVLDVAIADPPPKPFNEAVHWIEPGRPICAVVRC